MAEVVDVWHSGQLQRPKAERKCSPAIRCRRQEGRLAALLPESIGEFVARAPATSNVYLPEARIRAQRDYASADRTLQVELKTGNVRAQLELLASDSDHAFGSDSKTYWHTVPVKGLRARVAETDDKKWVARLMSA
ncbi:MAG TPA: hypothetical protein VIV60_35015 [Polyangiaceae bacterium]